MKKIKSNADLFAYIEELILIAKNNSDDEIAQSLQSSIQDNFIISEALGELVLILEKLELEKHKAYLNPHREKISNTVLEIRNAFKRANRPW